MNLKKLKFIEKCGDQIYFDAEIEVDGKSKHHLFMSKIDKKGDFVEEVNADGKLVSLLNMHNPEPVEDILPPQAINQMRIFSSAEGRKKVKQMPR